MSVFDAAIARVASFGSEVKVSDKDKLSLYALFKQARNGDVDDKSAPSRFNLVQYAKYSAWRELRGVRRQDAEQQYVDLVQRLDPSWVPEVSKEELKGEIFQRAREEKEEKQVEMNGGSHAPKQQILPPADRGNGTKPLRRNSLDQNFVVSLRSTTPAPRLSNALENVLRISTTRPRARSLDFEPHFVISPFAPPEAVGERVKQLVLKEDYTSATTPVLIRRTRSRALEHIEGIGNIRDFGGLPAITVDGGPGRIKKGKLLRCAQLSHATESDTRWLVEEFDLRTIVDLRSADAQFDGHLAAHFTSIHAHSQEMLSTRPAPRTRFNISLITRDLIGDMIRRRAPLLRKLHLAVLVALHACVSFIRKVLAPIPLVEIPVNAVLLRLERFLMSRIIRATRFGFADSGLQALYESLLLKGHKELRMALHALTQPESTPAAFNCAFGKDRTGVVAALILFAAGTPREVIVEDFALSHTFVDTELGAREWANSVKEMPELASMKDEWARSPAHYLSNALELIEEQYGTVEAYFEKALGFDKKWIASVRANFVEPIHENGF